MKKRIRIPKPIQVEDSIGYISILKNCEPLEAATPDDLTINDEWLLDYDPEQDIVFSWSYKGSEF